MFAFLQDDWPLLVTGLHLVLAGFAAGHVVLNKSDARAALGWMGLIWIAPVLGSIAYFWLGVNRMRRLASRRRFHAAVAPSEAGTERERAITAARTGPLAPLVELVDVVTGLPLVTGNDVRHYTDGDEAYAEMLTAIDTAEQSVTMCTYIFDAGRCGRAFVDSLSRAVDRGVAVRVLVDDVGARYSSSSVPRLLARAGVPVATFLPTLKPRSIYLANMRNHRKLLIVDGRVGFTGGMNIRDGHCRDAPPWQRTHDMHFRIEGPVVVHMQHVFVVDWSFMTNEVLQDEPWFATAREAGPVAARGIPDGPDEDFDKLEQVVFGAITCARSSIGIVTPYFLPEISLVDGRS